jgi:hypothetical protein
VDRRTSPLWKAEEPRGRFLLRDLSHSAAQVGKL